MTFHARFYSLLIVVLTFFAPNAVIATPSPGIVLSDQILGATERSYFVIRSISFYPPSYYSRHLRTEFLELSILDGSIRQSCLLRESKYQVDPDDTNKKWNHQNVQTPKCNPFKTLSKLNANYVVPKGSEPVAVNLQLSRDGLVMRQGAIDKWLILISQQDINKRAQKMTMMDASIVPWQLENGNRGRFSVHTMWEKSPVIHKQCSIDPDYETIYFVPWVFINFRCWSGDVDSDGANFYVPIRKEKWLKAIKE